MNRLKRACSFSLFFILPCFILTLNYSCNRISTKEHKYNLCDYYQSVDPNPSDPTGAGVSFGVTILDYKLNELDSVHSNGFLGAFKGQNTYTKSSYNFLVFDTINSKELASIIEFKNVVIILSKKNCIDFFSSFNFLEFIDKRFPIVIGTFVIPIKD